MVEWMAWTACRARGFWRWRSAWQRAVAPAAAGAWWRGASALALVALCGAGGLCGAAHAQAAAGGGAAPLTLRVIAFNDFHGHLEPGQLSLTLPDPSRPGATLRLATGGAAHLAGLVAALRQGQAHSVLVASGDMLGAAPLVSSLFRHESTVAVLNQMGVDVAALGNHELDAGLPELQRLLGGGCAAPGPSGLTGPSGQPAASAVPASSAPTLAPPADLVSATSPTVSCAIGSTWAGARFPVLAANVRGSDGAAPFAPSWVRQVGPVKVGFIGAVTRSTPRIVRPSAIQGLHFDDEAEAINRAAAVLKREGVHALVAVVHEGGELDRTDSAGSGPPDWNATACPGLRGAIVGLARRITPEVGLILSAHTHQGYNCVLDGRPVMQAVSYGRGLSVADLVLDPATGRIDRAQTVHLNLPVPNTHTEPSAREALASALPPPLANALRSARPHPAVARTVATYGALAAPLAQRRIGRLAQAVDRRGPADSSAGRLVADAHLAATQAPAQGGAHIAFTNPGGLRSDLPCRPAPCDVRYGDAFTLQPFGNDLVVMTLTGAELKALLENQRRRGRDGALLLQPSAGLSYRWLNSAPPGQQVQNLRLNGRPLAPDAQLRITVNSYLAEGGDGFAGFKAGRQRLGAGLDVDALVAWLATGPAPQPEARITWVD